MSFASYEAMPLSTMTARIQKYHPGDGYQLVEKAWAFAEEAHKGQVRKSGEPYFIHPCFVASILTELMIDPPTIAAGLLHDTVEDCEGITLETIRSGFGSEVAELVDGVTKLNKLDFANREEAQAESVRKMILAMSRDIRVVLIKLADRLHNMRTLKWQRAERQVPIARETLDIYAPLAHRLGVYALKQDLEDLSLKYLDPDGYNNIVHLVGMKRAEREANIRMVIDELSARLDEGGNYGRILREADGTFQRIVEARDCTPEQAAVTEVNTGTYVFHVPSLLSVLDRLKTDNAQGELYLTDVPALLKAQGARVGLCDTCSPDEMLGVNTVEQLAQVEELLRNS